MSMGEYNAGKGEHSARGSELKLYLRKVSLNLPAQILD